MFYILKMISCVFWKKENNENQYILKTIRLWIYVKNDYYCKYCTYILLCPQIVCIFTGIINGTILHQSKSVISIVCLGLKCSREYFSTVMVIFQHPFWWQICPTFETDVAFGVLIVNINLLCSSGVEELIYSRNCNWSLLSWPYNNPKGDGHIGDVQRHWAYPSTWALQLGSQSWFILWWTCTLYPESVPPWTLRMATQ